MKIALLILSSVLFTFILAGQSLQNPDPTRFQSEIDNFISWDAKNSFPENAVLFAGSSSIRMWKSAEAFPELEVINRGFGGAQISDLLYYFDQTVKKYEPRLIVFYCGDNDIDFGKAAEQTLTDFKDFMGRVEKLESKPPVIYLPAKPSPARWDKYPEMERLNNMIADLAGNNDNLIYVNTADAILNPSGKPKPEVFMPDSLHLNATGYGIWNRVVQPVILKEMHRH